MMNVVRADFAGACYGVQRALDLALSAADTPGNVFTLGPLIHNPQVVAQLARRGVIEAQSIEDVLPTSTVVIRSHGVTPDEMRKVQSISATIVDATCPYVSRAQNAAAELARVYGTVVVVGEEGHPEVEGLVARAREEGAQVIVVTTAQDIPPNVCDPVGVVVQTTQKYETLNEVVGELQKRGMHPQVKNTICLATRQRQEAAATLAEKVDAIVVIGGRNSSNTTRLANICKEQCVRTYHIETPSEIDPEWFRGCSTVGVTAGASTPETQIKDVIARLEVL